MSSSRRTSAFFLMIFATAVLFTVNGFGQVADGNLVGSETAQIVTADDAPHYTDCTTPQGFTGGTFSSVVELF